MNLFDFFRANKKVSTASVAKERLQIIVAHERGQRSTPDYLPALQRELLLKKCILPPVKKCAGSTCGTRGLSLPGKVPAGAGDASLRAVQAEGGPTAFERARFIDVHPRRFSCPPPRHCLRTTNVQFSHSP